MPATREYAQLGKTTWRADILLDDGGDPRARHLASAEYPNLGLAKAWVNRRLPVFYREDGHPWAELRRGTYEDDSFDDGEAGHVASASWEADQRSQWYGHLAEDSLHVDWQDDSA